ncbi:MAG: alpha-amylase family glycosyl hydrolase [bacterium]
MTCCVDDEPCQAPLARVFIDMEYPHAAVFVRVSVELYMRGVTDSGPIEDNELDVALWTDVDRHGFVDEKGMHYPDFGYLVPMKPARGPDGEALRNGNNAVFVSEPVPILKTGVFSYTVDFSADDYPFNSPVKKWIAANEISLVRDGVIVSSPEDILNCPSLMEICVRKYGASIENGGFISGKLKNVTRDLDNIPVDTLYLLPIFEPGVGDIITGKDVRKGELGSIYAVKDFFRLDPAICSAPEEVDFKEFLSQGLITDYDLVDILEEKQTAVIQHVSDFGHFKTNAEIVNFLGRDKTIQLIGRAELRELVAEAHKNGKKIIFDLVLMQTSRDSKLINEHRDWYALDEEGSPKIHKIAWLVYSDVALFDLLFNRPLQNYLSSIAPYWIRTCGLDGVRIDASQTVDRMFLKQIKNRINDVKQDAVVLGETLCPVCESVDIPTDIIYSLLVDHHVHIERAEPYYDLFEMYHHTFPFRTHAIAYFENHDSERATAQWQKHFSELLSSDKDALGYWKDQAAKSAADPAVIMSALKNLQCSLINMISGSVTGVNFCYALENGTDFGEMTRTDFENPKPLDFSLREKGPNAILRKAYCSLYKLKKKLEVIRTGRVYYLRNNLEPDQDDRVFALLRHDGEKRLLFLANLDPESKRIARFSIDFLNLKPLNQYPFKALYDTYETFGLKELPRPEILQGIELAAGKAAIALMPLQSLLITF